MLLHRGIDVAIHLLTLAGGRAHADFDRYATRVRRIGCGWSGNHVGLTTVGSRRWGLRVMVGLARHVAGEGDPLAQLPRLLKLEHPAKRREFGLRTGCNVTDVSFFEISSFLRVIGAKFPLAIHQLKGPV